MHERTRRAIARMTFVFCCAVPTFITVSIILVTWTPWWHHRSLASIEANLSRDTGLVVQIGDFRRAAPSTLFLFNVEILEPETGLTVASIREIRWAKRGKEVSIRLQQPELRSATLPQAWNMIHDRFLCRPDQTSLSLKMLANDLTIHSQTGGLTLTDVTALVRPRIGENLIEATVQGILATSDQANSESPVKLSILRDRSGQSPSTFWVLRSGDTPLPCSALAEYLPPLKRLGSDAMFSGTMRWNLRRNGWTIDLGDSLFTGIALSRWLEDQPYKVTGMSSVQLERCRIETEHGAAEMVDIAGVFLAGDGQVGPRLLMQAKRHLGFAAVDAEAAVQYDRIALGFNLNGPLLHLNGVCHTEAGYQGLPPGVVIRTGGNPIAESLGQTLQATALLSFFAPEHSVTAPLSQQTSPLGKLLMPPSSRLPPNPLAAPRITTKHQWEGGPLIEQR